MTQPNQPQTSQEQIEQLLKEAYQAFRLKEESLIFDEIVRLFNDGTLELVSLQQYQTLNGNELTFHGGLAARLGPKIQSLQQKVSELEAENQRLRDCCKDFEFVLEGSRALKQSDEMLEKRENALMRALDWDNPRQALKGEEK